MHIEKLLSVWNKIVLPLCTFLQFSTTLTFLHCAWDYQAGERARIPLNQLGAHVTPVWEEMQELEIQNKYLKSLVTGVHPAAVSIACPSSTFLPYLHHHLVTAQSHLLPSNNK